MIDKASAISIRVTRSRRIASVSLALIVVLLLVAGKAGAPYLFQGATLQSELATQVGLTTGLVVTSKDHGRFDLLPRPHIVMKGLHFADPSGALQVDAEELKGEVRLLPLLVGRIELGSATLVRPKLVVDFDGRPAQPDSMIGRTLHPIAHGSPAPSGRLGIVTLVDAAIVVKSKALGPLPDFNDVDVTIDWPDLDSPATVTGSFSVKKVAADVAIWLAQPSSLMRGEPSPLALRVQSTPLDLSANGDLVVVGLSNFRGHVALRAPSMSGVLALAAIAMPLPAPFANSALNSDVTLGIDRDGRSALNLSALRLRLDGNDYEGALAFQGGSRPVVTGTLATDRLTLAPFLDRMPPLLDAKRQWTHDPLMLAHRNPIALDLRISASHLLLAPFTVDDAALAIMTRGERTEIVLAEGKAYGGDVRARASVGISGDDLNLRGVCSLTNADAATLGWDLLGRQAATGTFSGSANLETNGSSMAALIGNLSGSMKGQASEGDFSIADLGLGLRTTHSEPLEALLPAEKGRTPFHDAGFALRLSDGEGTVADAMMHGSETTVTATGTLDFAERRLDLRVGALPAVSRNASPGKPPHLQVGGSFDRIVVTPEASEPSKATNATAR